LKFCEINRNQSIEVNIGDSLSGYSVIQFQYKFFTRAQVSIERVVAQTSRWIYSITN